MPIWEFDDNIIVVKVKGLSIQCAYDIERKLIHGFRYAKQHGILPKHSCEIPDKELGTFYRLTCRDDDGKFIDDWEFQSVGHLEMLPSIKPIMNEGTELYEFCKGQRIRIAISIPGDIISQCHIRFNIIDSQYDECSFEFKLKVLQRLDDGNKLDELLDLARLHVLSVHLLEALEVPFEFKFWDITWYHKGKPTEEQLLRWEYDLLLGTDNLAKFRAIAEHDIRKLADYYQIEMSRLFDMQNENTARAKILALRQTTGKAKMQTDAEFVCDEVRRHFSEKPTNVESK